MTGLVLETPLAHTKSFRTCGATHTAWELQDQRPTSTLELFSCLRSAPSSPEPKHFAYHVWFLTNSGLGRGRKFRHPAAPTSKVLDAPKLSQTNPKSHGPWAMWPAQGFGPSFRGSTKLPTLVTKAAFQASGFVPRGSYIAPCWVTQKPLSRNWTHRHRPLLNSVLP